MMHRSAAAPVTVPTRASQAATPEPPTADEPGTVQPLPVIRRMKQAIARLIIVFASVFTIRYFYWRWTETMNPAARWFFWGFLIAEGLNFIEAALFYITTWAPTRYAAPPVLKNKTVDVFIATYNEPIELLRETVLCAVNMTYPHKTYVLDDGNRAQVQELAQELGAEYIARMDNKHAKAGNLNNALQQTTGEFILTLDADHVPSPDLIEQVIGFFRDYRVGAVQTAQDFYNHDSFQHRMNWKAKAGWQQQELFFSVIQPGKDRFNAAFYCGSPAMLRRTALAQVGGFATESITEDMHTGLRMQKRNWRVLYHNKTLAYGLAPQTFLGFSTQWRRWGSGCMQVLREENPIFGRGLSLGQRICYFASMYFYWMSYQKLLYLLTPIVALITGVFPLITTPELFVKFFFPYFFLNLFASVILQGGFTSYLRSEQFNILKMHVLMPTVSGLFRKRSKFKVTPKSQADAASISDVALPVALSVLLVVSIVVGFIRLRETSDEYLFWALLVNIFWSAFYFFMMFGVIWSAMRRKEVRLMYRFPARLNAPVTLHFKREDGTQAEVADYARNLNRTGVSVTLDEAIPPGAMVELELLLPKVTIHASGEVMRNQRFHMKRGTTRISNGIRFTNISVQNQDEISKFLFGEVAPREQTALRLTQMTQREA
jgi:cellulose synthase (UDP-forming)